MSNGSGSGVYWDSNHAIKQLDEARAEIERLRDFERGALRTIEDMVGQIDRLREQLKDAVWADSEECKFLTEDNKRLRTVLEAVLKGVLWDEKSGHINGPKTMVYRALGQAREG